MTLEPVRDAHGAAVQSQKALRLRDELITELACLPAVQGVLDAVIEAFGLDEVAEITGRSRRVVSREGRRVVERRSAKRRGRRPTPSRRSKRILVFSDAGGTGRSYHACNNSTGRDHRRVHYLAEPGWRADAAIQGLGRTHRTNQASAPLFRPVTTDIKGETRFLSTIARRLNSLGALTRGERRSAGNGGGSACITDTEIRSYGLTDVAAIRARLQAFGREIVPALVLVDATGPGEPARAGGVAPGPV